ncbi:hypothetical protein [Robiginitomaculum antarcticum]|uniref:hypothetical protein n=1 Tax=Robiginitomaculum antarcticum TaxID=437507 RepID=UPI00036D01E1|nr:hypothetical protein [Robiginitomaculum antarcticum]
MAFNKFMVAVALASLLASVGCEKKVSKPDISTLSTAQLEAAIAKGGDRTAEKLRLSKMYTRYGNGAQKQTAYDMLLDMAEAGNGDAAVGLCGFTDDITALGFCQKAADEGDQDASAQICVMTPSAQNAYCESPAAAGITRTYLFYAQNLAAENKWDEAAIWFEKAIKDGPVEHRDPAVTAMTQTVKNKADNPYYKALQASGGKLVKFEVLDAITPTTPAGLRRDAQCYVTWTVTPTGVASNVKINCADDVLIDPVSRAVHAWRFKPSRKNSVAVFDSSRASTTIYFKAPQ